MNEGMEEEELRFTFGYLYLTLRSDQFLPYVQIEQNQARHI